MKRKLTILTLMFLSAGLFAQNEMIFNIEIDSINQDSTEVYFQYESYTPIVTTNKQHTIKTIPFNIKRMTQNIRRLRSMKANFEIQLMDTTYDKESKTDIETDIKNTNNSLRSLLIQKQFKVALRDSTEAYIQRIEL